VFGARGVEVVLSFRVRKNAAATALCVMCSSVRLLEWVGRDEGKILIRIDKDGGKWE